MVFSMHYIPLKNKNYRPLSLMNIDYKILSNVLNNRSKKALSTVIHLSRSYGIPENDLEQRLHHPSDHLFLRYRNRKPTGIIQCDHEENIRLHGKPEAIWFWCTFH